MPNDRNGHDAVKLLNWHLVFMTSNTTDKVSKLGTTMIALLISYDWVDN